MEEIVIESKNDLLSSATTSSLRPLSCDHVVLLLIMNSHGPFLWGCFDQHTFPFSNRDMEILNHEQNIDWDEWFQTCAKWNKQLNVWHNQGCLNSWARPTMEMFGHRKVTVHVITARHRYDGHSSL
jgi:hypothetical protein